MNDPRPTEPQGEPSGPMFRIAFLFHSELDLLKTTLPRCLDALTAGTSQSFEVVLRADGTPDEVAEQLPALLNTWGVDELHLRHAAGMWSAGIRRTTATAASSRRERGI